MLPVAPGWGAAIRARRPGLRLDYGPSVDRVGLPGIYRLNRAPYYGPYVIRSSLPISSAIRLPLGPLISSRAYPGPASAGGRDSIFKVHGEATLQPLTSDFRSSGMTVILLGV